MDRDTFPFHLYRFYRFVKISINYEVLDLPVLFMRSEKCFDMYVLNSL